MFLKLSCYGGMCHQDMSTTKKQLMFNGDYDIPKDKIEQVIVDYLIELFPFMERKIFEDAILKKEKVTFPVLNIKTNKDGEEQYEDCEFYIENDKTWYEHQAIFDGSNYDLTEEYSFGQVNYKTRFYLQDIPKENVCYLVEELFIGPYKYCDIIERIYVEPFKNIQQAKEFFETFKTHNGYIEGRKEIFVANYETLKETKWFELNMECISLLKNKGNTLYDETFSMDVTGHIENLKKC